MRRLLFILLIIPMLSAWPTEDAEASVCFDAQTTSNARGSADASFYSVMILPVPENTTFWNRSSLWGYHTDTGTRIPIFIATRNTTHYVALMELVSNLTAGSSDNYCVYAGGDDWQDLSDIAPYSLGIDEEDDVAAWTAHNDSAYTAVWADGRVNLSSTGAMGWFNPAASSSYSDVEILTKSGFISGNTSSNTSIIGSWSNYYPGTTTLTANGCGNGMAGTRARGCYYVYTTGGAYYYPHSSTEYIFRLQARRGSSSFDGLYDVNMSLLNYSTYTGASTAMGNIRGTYPFYVRNATGEFDWGIAYYSGSSLNNWSLASIVWDEIDTDIVIESPGFDEEISDSDAALLRIHYLQGFDMCNVSLNTHSAVNYTALASDSRTNLVLDDSQMVVGRNNITVECTASSVTTHRYWHFYRIGADINYLFDDAFGIDYDDLDCSAATSNALGDACFESYNFTGEYPFGAVVCNGLDTTQNFSCLTTYGNTTKNGYTIYYNPSTWEYDTSVDLPHVGANFYYSGAEIDGRIELYMHNRFMYTPAQDKDRDCDIYYTGVSYCSWWHGFVLNNATIYVSDSDNNWYSAGGLGVDPFTTNTSLSVINVGVMYVPETGEDLYPYAIYIRHSCYESDGEYVMKLQSTESRNFTVVISGTGDTGYTISSTTLIDSINLSGIYTIQVSDQDRTLCAYNSSHDFLFVDIDLSGLSIEGYPVIPMAMLLFGVVLSAIIPPALFIAVVVNDVYRLIDVADMALLVVFACIAGLVNNAQSFNRGMKHVVIIFVIFLAYVIQISDVFDSYDAPDYEPLQALYRSLITLTEAQDPAQFFFNLFAFMASFFWILLTLPYVLIDYSMALIASISPEIYGAASLFASMLKVGLTAYILLKAFEVIRNQFNAI